MKDIAVFTPSRARAKRLQEMLGACYALSEADTDVVVALDDDDFALPEYERLLDDGRTVVVTGPRQSLCAWTNDLVRTFAADYRCVASLGDDHIPRTQGWDLLLLEAIDRMGGTGIAYGDDTIMGERLPTAPVISADIVQALGWMMEPSLRHMCVDLCWKDLGLGADCLAYRPDVVIEHMHWGVSKSPLDATYAEAEAGHQEDRDAYAIWQQERMAADVAKIRAPRKKAA